MTLFPSLRRIRTAPLALQRLRTVLEKERCLIAQTDSGGEAEHISINLRAVPSFEAFGSFVERANPFVFWVQAVQLTWLPWLAAAQAAIPPSLGLPQTDSQGCRSKGASHSDSR
jgi:hypothetical protein